MTKRRLAEIEKQHFVGVNEQEVEDITLEFFYKPHTLTLLGVAIATTLYFAFTRTNEVSSEQNISNGLCFVAFFFLIIGLLTFPNGPFTRPHPAIWRVVFGISVMYMLLLVFVLFQNYQDVRKMLFWVFPDLEAFDPPEKEYAVNCSDVSLDRIWGHVDWFAFCHFGGWALKAMLMRHYGILWTISIMWEITEFFYIHLLPNFAECWWDTLLLDVLVCNGLGIYVGMKVGDWLEIRNYHWDSIKDIKTTSGKIKRAVLQFTPASWTHVRWLDPESSFMRVIAIYIMMLVTQLAELNTFFLKYIFNYPINHWIGIIRILIICAIVAPTIRQYYTYVTDPMCKRVGTQLWVFTAITVLEFIISIKHGQHVFSQTIFTNVILWLLVQMGMVLICLYILWFFFTKQSKKTAVGRLRNEPMDRNSTAPRKITSTRAPSARTLARR
ncbi:phosphatidylserine synthase 1-like isoform X2 [Apostichopus japonicus]|uniref:phosphatidylserine synthase 1-like isoform X2 n=1 Tax=Stichopus japonicus TaxID=307972 RepID=UPI003AB571AC